MNAVFKKTLRSKSLRMSLVIGLIDFVLVWLIFKLTDRYIGQFSECAWERWALASAALWTLLGLVTGKLLFWKFRRRKYGVLSIAAIDVLTYLLCFVWLLPAFGVPMQSGPVPLVLIILIELLLFGEFRELVVNKMPLYYEPIVVGSQYEHGVESGTKLKEHTAEVDADILSLHNSIRTMSAAQLAKWIGSPQTSLPDGTFVARRFHADELPHDGQTPKRLVLCVDSFNNCPHINTFFNTANRCLADGGFLYIHGVTSAIKKQQILRSAPWGINYILAGVDYIWNRFIPKLESTRWFYMAVTNGKHRSFSRVEILGRICRAGFEIIDDDIREGQFFVMARKIKEPVEGDKPSYRILIRLHRVGYQGRIIDVYKFRTMYAYSEYIQNYAYQHLGLQDGGKLKDDFRVNFWGHLLRSIWLDELPMVLNLLKGDLKLVGVRPLSKHFYSLYTPEMQQLRIKVKPGLIPPFYYGEHRPVTLQDVMESERIYTESYLQHPFRTDWCYFWGSVRNILFGHARSH